MSWQSLLTIYSILFAVSDVSLRQSYSCAISIKISRQYPILVKSEFNSSYESVISQSSVVTPAINALVYAVLAIGCYNSVKGIGDNGFQRRKQANDLISIAMRERANLLNGIPSVEKIQVRKF